MVINISINKTFNINDSVKNYSCYNVFNKKNINTFDILTFMQMHTVLTDKKSTSGNDHTRKKVIQCSKQFRSIDNNSL